MSQSYDLSQWVTVAIFNISSDTEVVTLVLGACPLWTCADCIEDVCEASTQQTFGLAQIELQVIVAA